MFFKDVREALSKDNKLEFELSYKMHKDNVKPLIAYLTKDRNFYVNNNKKSTVMYTNYIIQQDNGKLRYTVDSDNTITSQIIKNNLMIKRFDQFNAKLSSEINILKKTTLDEIIAQCKFKRYISRRSFNNTKFKSWLFDISMVTTVSTDIDGNESVEVAGELEIEFIPTGDHQMIEKDSFDIINEMKKILLNLNIYKLADNFDPIRHVYKSMHDYKDKFFKYNTIKSINATKVLTASIWREIKMDKKELYITHKIDGIRKILMKNKNTLYILNTSEDIKVILLNDNKLGNFIIDCEEYNGKYYIFDIYQHEYKDVSHYNFSNKLTMIQSLENKINNLNVVSVYIKEFMSLNSEMINKELTKFINSPCSYETDGFIIVNNKESYKYKTYNTIDFSLFKIPNVDTNSYYLCSGANLALLKTLNFKPEYVLFNKNDINKKVFPIKFISSMKSIGCISRFTFQDDKDYNNTIGEFNYNKEKDSWEFVKTRTDRSIIDGSYYGNYYAIAETNFLLSMCPFVIYAGDSYFNDSNKHKSINIRKLINSFKRELIKEYTGNRLLDIGGGRGQDMDKYTKGEEAVIIDKDPDALVELMQRRLSQPKDRPINRVISCVNLDMTCSPQRFDEIMKKYHDIQKESFNAIYCNLAVHYFFGSLPNADNAIKNISNYMKEGSKLVIVFLSGSKIKELLSGLKNNDVIKINDVYSIKKKYKEVKSYGTKIGLTLPFTKEGEFYDENLVDEDVLTDLCLNNNLHLHSSMHINEKDYILKDARYESLTEKEKEYLGLHKAMIFTKERSKIY